jgi:hypothetical protein
MKSKYLYSFIIILELNMLKVLSDNINFKYKSTIMQGHVSFEQDHIKFTFLENTLLSLIECRPSISQQPTNKLNSGTTASQSIKPSSEETSAQPKTTKKKADKTGNNLKQQTIPLSVPMTIQPIVLKKTRRSSDSKKPIPILTSNSGPINIASSALEKANILTNASVQDITTLTTSSREFPQRAFTQVRSSSKRKLPRSLSTSQGKAKDAVDGMDREVTKKSSSPGFEFIKKVNSSFSGLKKPSSSNVIDKPKSASTEVINKSHVSSVVEVKKANRKCGCKEYKILPFGQLVGSGISINYTNIEMLSIAQISQSSYYFEITEIDNKEGDKVFGFFIMLDKKYSITKESFEIKTQRLETLDTANEEKINITASVKNFNIELQKFVFFSSDYILYPNKITSYNSLAVGLGMSLNFDSLIIYLPYGKSICESFADKEKCSTQSIIIKDKKYLREKFYTKESVMDLTVSQVKTKVSIILKTHFLQYDPLKLMYEEVDYLLGIEPYLKESKEFTI